HGAISARGGLLGGAGGSIETSGKVGLDVSGSTVTASAARGRAGHWLLDPTDYVIDAGQAASIQAALESGTPVEVATDSVGVQPGDLTVAAAINKTMGPFATLTLTAHNDIDVQQPITLVSGGLMLNAGRDIKGTGALNVDGDTRLNAIGNITASLGGGALYGPVFLNGNTATVTSDGPTVLGASSIAGAFNLTSAGDITQSGSLSVGGTTSLNISDAAASHSVLLGQANDLRGNIALAFAGPSALDLAIRNSVAPPAGGLALGAATFRDVSLTFDSGDVTLPSITALGRLDLTATAGSLSQAAASTLNAQVLSARALRAITFDQNNSLPHLADINGDSVTLKTSGNIDQVADTRLRVNSRFSLDAAGLVRLDQDNHLAGRVDLTTPAADPTPTLPAVTLRNVQDLTLGDINVVNGTLDLRAQGLLSTDPKPNVTQVAGSTIKARILTADVGGDLSLGFSHNSRSQAPSSLNEFDVLVNIKVGGELSLFDASSTIGGYGPYTEGDTSVSFTADPLGSKTLGLRIVGAVEGRNGVTIRTRGDLLIEVGGTVRAPGASAEAILSAESGPATKSLDFHNNNGDQNNGPGGNEHSVMAGGRFLIFSSSADANTPRENEHSTQVRFGLPDGVQATFTRDQLTIADLASLPRTGDGFIFSLPQDLKVPDESSKFVVDVLKVKPVAPVTFSLDVSRLPVPELGNIYVSSYHIYAEEAEEKKKGKHKKLAELELKLDASVLAVNEEPLR
ncbi:MAG TPA: hypothetical protein VNH84_17065, partial [Candidatus Saccharimonadales bacterium]|nr:hypothetical protein [Candidatus Saccharimonadales bacterium]